MNNAFISDGIKYLCNMNELDVIYYKSECERDNWVLLWRGDMFKISDYRLPKNVGHE